MSDTEDYNELDQQEQSEGEFEEVASDEEAETLTIDEIAQEFVENYQDDLDELVQAMESLKELNLQAKEVRKKKKDLSEAITRRFNRLPKEVKEKGIKYESVTLKIKTKTKIQRRKKADAKEKTLELLGEYISSKKAESLYEKLLEVNIEAKQEVKTLDIKKSK